jgi:hypothetical protein
VRWNPKDLPTWLTTDSYQMRIVPRLASVRTADVARCLGVSESYAAQVRKGDRVPHPRRWVQLAKLVGLDDSLSKP